MPARSTGNRDSTSDRPARRHPGSQTSRPPGTLVCMVTRHSDCTTSAQRSSCRWYLSPQGIPFCAVGRVHLGIFYVVIRYVVALHPGPKISIRNIVLGLAGPHAVAASNAFRQVDQHAPPVLAHLV